MIKSTKIWILVAALIVPGVWATAVSAQGADDWGRADALYRMSLDETDALAQNLIAAASNTGRLHVDTLPQGARVRIMNIKPKFYQGIKLNKGRYRLEVSADGWETKVMWVTLGAGEDKKVTVRLERVSAGVSGKRLTNSLGMEFEAIPAGSFTMGSPSSEKGRDRDERRHRVRLSRGFYMQTTEVTQGQWRAVMGNNPSGFKSCGDDCPVEHVSWRDVQKFISELNRREGGKKYRLPTEAEWEYAARAGGGRAYSYGGDKGQFAKYAWFIDNSGGRPHPVARKKANAWGLYDMHGNVWEWCQDWYGGYPSKSVTNPRGPKTGSGRVNRGGSWSSSADGCRSANRFKSHPGRRYGSLGFRLARSQ